MARQLVLFGCGLLVWVSGCKAKHDQSMLVARETFAELRVIKGNLSIAEPGKTARPPYPRERLGDGARLSLEADSVAFMRDDHGATWLLAGPAQATIRQGVVELGRGKAFVDTQGGPAVTLATTSGVVEIADGRSSITVAPAGTVEAYVLRGSLRHGPTRAAAGEMLTLGKGTPAQTNKLNTWTDWTSGLATADPDAQPAPYGVGTVGARKAGDQGKPRFSLVIQRLEVKVTIDHDYAETEVDQSFVNSSADEVEGLFSFRVPQNAFLHRFGVDRDGLLVWGKPKEKRTAAAQYASNVYAGSTEDPALLEWVQRGVYQARLYPIGAGATRRVVTRYGEWLARHGERGERRQYVYPMAATGAEGTLPRIEELTIRIDWTKARSTRVRAPLGSVVRGKQLVLKGFDVLPKADFAVELFDAGRSELLAYRAKHALSNDDAPVNAEPEFAHQTSQKESDYLLLPLLPPKQEQLEPGLDLAIVVDSSAANDASAMAISRSLVESLLTALGPTDRAALFAGDTTLRPVAAESAQLMAVDEARRQTWLAELANAPVGGATDIGTILAEAAERLEAKRRGAVIYIGDGRPSVGELLPKALRERLTRLPPTARVFAVGVGTDVNRALLESLVRGAPLETAQNAYEAAQAALRLLEAATQPSWQNVSVELAGIDRLLPKSIVTVSPGEPTLLIGRVAGTTLGDKVRVTDANGTRELPLRIVSLDDDGDLRRRWGDGRLSELVEQHAGRLAIVDLARRYGLLTPFTSLYVATRKEAEAEGNKGVAERVLTPDEKQRERDERLARWRPWSFGNILTRKAAPPAMMTEDAPALVQQAMKEGGTGTRAKGEEGSMGNRSTRPKNRRYSAGAKDSPDDELSAQGNMYPNEPAPAMAPLGAVTEEKRGELTVGSGAGLQPIGGIMPPSAAAPTKSSSLDAVAASAEGSSALDDKLGGEGDLGRVKRMREAANSGIGLGAIGSESKADASDPLAEETKSPRVVVAASAKARFGSGHGRLGGNHVVPTPKIRLGDDAVEVKELAPTTPPPAASAAIAKRQTPIAQLSHEKVPCSAASDLPLNERRKLWRERLNGNTSASGVRDVYESAIRGCEAPGWYERQLLLYAMVERLPNVAERVQLYRSFAYNSAVAGVVYRAILVRIADAADMRALHEALEIKLATPELIANLLQRAKDPRSRVRFLRDLVAAWPSDLELMLQLLEAHEDAQDFAAARALARNLRRRADTTAHVRTLVGEFYWRCSERETERDKIRDLEEARRAFGEIVEFAPDDPAARRRLGDLLRSHGWYEEALRQYETLRELLPEDPTVHLLIAAAAQGMGKTEEALRWSEKAASTAAPDARSLLESAAQAEGSVFLAWAREDALKQGRTSDAERLLLRGRKLTQSDVGGEGSIRFILTWEHPELRPILYGITRDGPVLGRQMTQLGVAEQFASPEEPRVELRLDPNDFTRVARLRAEVVLTAIVGEGTASQQATRVRLRFGDLHQPKPVLRYAYVDGALREEAL